MRNVITGRCAELADSRASSGSADHIAGSGQREKKSRAAHQYEALPRPVLSR
jgi:hypothetical protein